MGEALYNLVLNEGGGVIEDLIVYRLADERFFVVPNAANAQRVLQILEETPSEDRLHLMYHQDWCFLAVQGPESVHVMQRLFPEAGDLAFMQCVEAEYRRRPVILTRSGYTGEVGFELFTYQDVAHELWADLTEAMAPFGGQPCGLAARDVLRLEMGYPLYGQDLFESGTALEAGLVVGGLVRQGRRSAAGRPSSARRRRGSRAGCADCAWRSDATSRARTTRCSSGIRWSARSRAGRSHRRCRPGSGSPTSGRRTWPTWATSWRSTSGGGAAAPRSSGRRSSIAPPR